MEKWVAPYSFLNGASASKQLIKWSHQLLQIAQPLVFCLSPLPYPRFWTFPNKTDYFYGNLSLRGWEIMTNLWILPLPVGYISQVWIYFVCEKLKMVIEHYILDKTIPWGFKESKCFVFHISYLYVHFDGC